MTLIVLLRNMKCQNRIQSILKSHEKASQKKNNLQKFKPYELWYINIELINQDK